MVTEYGLAIAIAASGLAAFAGGVGSAVGVSLPAQAAAGVLREDPEKFGSLFLLVVLPGTQGFYGFIAAFLIIVKIGLLGGSPVAPTLAQGVQILFAAVPVAVTGLFSGIYQGKACTSGVYLVSRHAEEVMKAVIFAAMVETYAVLGLLATFFLLNGIKLG